MLERIKAESIELQEPIEISGVLFPRHIHFKVFADFVLKMTEIDQLKEKIKLKSVNPENLKDYLKLQTDLQADMLYLVAKVANEEVSIEDIKQIPLKTQLDLIMYYSGEEGLGINLSELYKEYSSKAEVA